MSMSSNDLILKIETQKTNENPYSKFHDENKKNKRRQVKQQSYYKIYEPSSLNSHLLLIISIIFTCLFYSLILKIHKYFLFTKFYHSFSLGIICVIDYCMNKEYYTTFNNEQFDRGDLQEPLFKRKEFQTIGELRQRYMTNREVYFYSLIVGIVSFTTELLIFYLLSKSTHMGYNSAIGFSLLSLEYIMIRLHYSMEHVKLEFINFTGILIILFIFLYVSLQFLDITIATVGLFICVLKFIKFSVFLDMSKYNKISNDKVILGMHTVDFIIGMVIVFLYLLDNDNHRLFNFSHIFIVGVGTTCYYLNIKYFRGLDRYLYLLTKVWNCYNGSCFPDYDAI